MARPTYPSDLVDKTLLRFPDGLGEKLRAAAAENKRSLNSEIVARLEQSFEGTNPGSMQAALAAVIDGMAEDARRAPGGEAAKARREISTVKPAPHHQDQKARQAMTDTEPKHEVLVQVTLGPSTAAALDAFIAEQPEPKPSRPEPIRALLAYAQGADPMTDNVDNIILEHLRALRSDIKDIRSEMADMRSEMATKSDLADLRSELKSDIADVRSDLVLTRKELSEQVVGLRRAVVEYHSSVIGHGIIISELEARMRRVEQHLNLPAPDAH
eukprot:gene20634-21308_t